MAFGSKASVLSAVLVAAVLGSAGFAAQARDAKATGAGKLSAAQTDADKTAPAAAVTASAAQGDAIVAKAQAQAQAPALASDSPELRAAYEDLMRSVAKRDSPEILRKALALIPQYEQRYSDPKVTYYVTLGQEDTLATLRAHARELPERKAQALSSGWADAYGYAASEQLRLGDAASAMRNIKKGIALSPFNPTLQIMLAGIQSVLGEQELALQSLENAKVIALRHWPQELRASSGCNVLRVLAHHYLKARQWDKAESAVNECIALKHDATLERSLQMLQRIQAERAAAGQ